MSSSACDVVDDDDAAIGMMQGPMHFGNFGASGSQVASAPSVAAVLTLFDVSAAFV